MRFSIFILLVFSGSGFAQKAVAPTSALRVYGKVKKESTFVLADFKKFSVHSIRDVDITNHVGEPRGKAAQMRGVLLKDVLQTIELDSPSPKELSAFYLICRAADGYIVVFSWNEIFNSPTGEAVFIVIEKEGKPLPDMAEAVLLISPTDLRTGRRFVKSLAEIEVARVQAR